MSAPVILRHPDADGLAQAVAARFVTRLADVQATGRVAQVVLTGGRVASAVYRAVASSPARTAVDWRRVEFWWGDERFVAEDDADRNAAQAWDAFLTALDVDPELVHAMPADSGQTPEEAADRYADELAAAATRTAGPAEPGVVAEPGAVVESGIVDGSRVRVPTFDLLLLGVGPDGHVASLFPGYEQLGVDDRSAVAVHDSPKPPPTRISLTFPALARAHEVWFVVSGEDKADAVSRAVSGAEGLPASTPRGLDRTLWLLDQEAAGQLS